MLMNRQSPDLKVQISNVDGEVEIEQQARTHIKPGGLVSNCAGVTLT